MTKRSALGVDDKWKREENRTDNASCFWLTRTIGRGVFEPTGEGWVERKPAEATCEPSWKHFSSHSWPTTTW
jgi:hypothetical protein